MHVHYGIAMGGGQCSNVVVSYCGHGQYSCGSGGLCVHYDWWVVGNVHIQYHSIQLWSVWAYLSISADIGNTNTHMHTNQDHGQACTVWLLYDNSLLLDLMGSTRLGSSCTS